MAGIMRALMKNPVLILALAISGAAMALGLWSWQQWVNTTAGQSQWAAATVLPKARALPSVSLLDQDGKAFHLDQLQGRWSVLFFGFTNCPDICPNTLALLNAVNETLLSEQRDTLQMVLVSVDPRRDTPEKLRAYVRYFDESMLGVTGSEASLQSLTSALYLPYQVGEPDDRGNYTVDHSASLVLVNPEGFVKAYFSAPHQLDPMLVDLRKLTES